MKKIFLLLFLLISLNAEILNEEQLNKVLSSYYKMDKEKISLKNVLETLKFRSYLKEDLIVAPIGSFFSKIINSDNLSLFIAESKKWSDLEKRVLVHAIIFSDLSNKEMIVLEILNKKDKESAFYFNSIYSNVDNLKIEDLKLDNPAVIDMYWGCYFATGNKFYIEKMIKQLDNKDTDLSNSLTREAIKWSFMSNATKNKDLISIIKESKASVETEAFLRDMINQLEKTN